MVAARAYIKLGEPLTVGTSVPQEEGVGWLKRAAQRARDRQSTAEVGAALELYDRLLDARHIVARTTCLPDYTHDQWDRMTLFRPSDASTAWFDPALGARMAVFRARAGAVADQAFRDDVEPPHYAVQVSCTGYDSPHALQRVICQKGWATSTKFWHIGHMGCYAAIPALAMAASFVSDEARVDGAPRRGSLLFVELCTLHLKPHVLRDDQVVMNTLFADGAARVDVSSHPDGCSFALIGTTEVMIPDTSEDMTWTVSDSAFDMVLARTVPVVIGREIASFVERFLRTFDLDVSRVAHFAIHPGGPRIVEMVARRLGLGDAATVHSLEVLRHRGNMSSATVPHIWRLMQEDPAVRGGDLVMSLAFGPGLTVTANLLQRVG